MERGVQIRSISRSIAVLQVINRRGSLSLMEIARMSRLPYPTASRIIQTLMHEGLVECESTRKFYRATGRVLALSQGFRNQDTLVLRARPFIVALTRQFGWPVSITTRIGQSMMVRDSTHDLTALTTKLHPPGYSMPLLDSGAGQVYVAHLDDLERNALIESVEADPGSQAWSLFTSEASAATIARIREAGHVGQDDEPDPTSTEKTSSISVPLRDETGLVGALTLVFFTSTVPMTEALARYLPDLKATAGLILDAVGATSAPGPQTTTDSALSV